MASKLTLAWIGKPWFRHVYSFSGFIEALRSRKSSIDKAVCDRGE